MNISLKNYNRDGASIFFKDNGEYYTLDCDGDKFYREYIRIIGKNENYPDAVDPPGGPMISIGNKYDSKIVSKITWFKDEPIKFYLEDAIN